MGYERILQEGERTVECYKWPRGTSMPGGEGNGVWRKQIKVARFRRLQRKNHPLRIAGEGATPHFLTHRQSQNVVGGGQSKAEPLGVVAHSLKDR